ncbi:MBOAT family O-acyltransferase [Pseudorhodobacter aquimaris]|uniref:MBOAT family O-acyltransferase n=1 Tax=Pseudorhodobacter aquimaris TaxID=687412 RepID=UPI00067D0BA8|nr:MBOAT family O-acyltransferase [Pseudorhodobacter aquimaris]
MIQYEIWWLYLIAAPTIYWLIPAAYRAWFLSAISLVLLAYFAKLDLVLMCGLALVVFYGRGLDEKRWPEWAVRAGKSTALAWLVFIYFIVSKYIPTIAKMVAGQASFIDFAVPLGVSYFSFKLLHYAIENRRGNLPAHGLDDFISWLFLAPIFTAGPIERFDHFLHNREVVTFKFKFIREGVERIAVGLVKKYMLGMLVLEAMQQMGSPSIFAMARHLDDFSVLQIWGLLFLSFLYLYLDFSAYSDIAIGSSRLFGLRIMENFNLPFLATSLPDFWQRWHMTLAQWVRTYIYMSIIGLTRNPYWAVIISFTMMGLWHAASPHWAAWGMWHGVGLAIFVMWHRYATRHKVRFFKTRIGGISARILTLSYVSLGGAFTGLYQHGSIWDSFRIMLHAFGIRV